MMPFSNPKFFPETLTAYSGPYFFMYEFKLELKSTIMSELTLIGIY